MKRQVIDTDWFAKVDECDCVRGQSLELSETRYRETRLTGFVDGKAVRIERDEKVANWPVLNVYWAHRVVSTKIWFHEERTEREAPSSKMTLSPKTVMSNLPVASSLDKMLRIGFDRAFRSMAATPVIVYEHEPEACFKKIAVPSLILLPASSEDDETSDMSAFGPTLGGTDWKLSTLAADNACD